MDFGYFTLSDNHYENNPRSANQFIADITAEALHADALGMHSACAAMTPEITAGRTRWNSATSR